MAETTVQRAHRILSETLVAGFAGPTLSPESRKNFIQAQIKNFILFSINKNYENKTQLSALCQDLKTLGSHERRVLITVDHEGGRVQRFREGFLKLPPALERGQRQPDETEASSFAANSELKECGIDLNFAPVCDLNTNPSNPVIGDRSFGGTVDQAAPHIEAWIRGSKRAGIYTCAKHFPGHGDTTVDSHYALPTVHTDLATLRTREWQTFVRAIRAGVDTVMSAHVIVTAIDPNRPSTLSPTVLQNYLRGELGFTGPVFSDDLQMQAITDHYGRADAPVLALNAGCDFLCYRNEPEVLFARESVVRAYDAGKITDVRVAEIERRHRGLL